MNEVVYTDITLGDELCAICRTRIATWFGVRTLEPRCDECDALDDAYEVREILVPAERTN